MLGGDRTGQDWDRAQAVPAGPIPGCAHSTCLLPQPWRRGRQTAGVQHAWEKLLQQRGKSCRPPGCPDMTLAPPPQPQWELQPADTCPSIAPPRSSMGCHKRPSAPALTRARDMLLCCGQGTLQTCPPQQTSSVLWRCEEGEAGQQERVLAAGKAAGKEGCCGQTRRAATPGALRACPTALLSFAGSHPRSTPCCQGRRPQLWHDPCWACRMPSVQTKTHLGKPPTCAQSPHCMPTATTRPCTGAQHKPPKSDTCLSAAHAMKKRHQFEDFILK